MLIAACRVVLCRLGPLCAAASQASFSLTAFSVYLHHVAAYLPTAVVTNEHFTQLNGLASDWITERTGIEERR